MKKHSKVGNKQGKPAYRTPSGFIGRVVFSHGRKQSARMAGRPRGYSVKKGK